MARRPRIEYPGALYHVISRGNQRQKIFRAPADYTRYCHLLARYQHRYGFSLYAYVLMPTHIHLLVETGLTPLSKVMQGLQQSYTLYVNRRYNLIGHLFQGRYKAVLCQKDAYLLELIRYIHLNPVRARLTQSPQAYRWSSHGIYLHGRPHGGVTVDPVLAQFGRTRARAIAGYRAFVREGLRQGHRAELYQATDERVLGDETFIARVAGREQRQGPVGLVKTSLPEVTDLVSRATGVPRALLTDRGRYRAAAQARALVAHVAREVGGIPLSATARYFGRDQVTVSLGVRKLQERQREEPHLGTLIKRLGAVLRRGRGGRI